jgi:hypothetical protein
MPRSIGTRTNWDVSWLTTCGSMGEWRNEVTNMLNVA